MIRQLLISLLGLVSLSGCISLLPDSGDLPPRIALEPDAKSRDPADEPKYEATLIISDAGSAAVLNTFSVAIATAPLEYQYLADAEWTDRVPVLLRRFLIRQFEDSGLFVAVGDRTELVQSDYTLQPDVLAFHIDATSRQEVAEVSIHLLLKDRRGKALGTRTFSGSVPIASSSRQDRAQALNKAAKDVADQMTRWVETRLEP